MTYRLRTTFGVGGAGESKTAKTGLKQEGGGHPPTTVRYMQTEELAKEKQWIFRLPDTKASEPATTAIAETLGIPTVVARLLYCRGYDTPEAARVFLAMESELLCDPFSMKDAKEAAERILRAVSVGERITVFGDYDVDGVTAVSTLYLYLRSLGADVGYYIPNRATDGYGVTCGALDGIFADGTKLVVTVDTGITAINEVEYARSHGVDFVVTDHHECHTELPHCPTVNPHRPDCPYPFKELSGVGVVFKLITAAEELRTGESRMAVASRLFAAYADLVAIGTIADVMPVTGENRLIVGYGLHMMEHPTRVGLIALMDAAAAPSDAKHPEKRRKKPKITSSYIGYTLAPRINAAGRVMSASLAVELFLSEDYSRAYEIAEELCDANHRRQAEENKIIKEAYAAIEADPKLKNEDPVIVLHADNWHHGVIGIVASRITERYCRPSILVSFEGCGDRHLAEDVGKGSGRSIHGLNLVEALCASDKYLVKFGGHELAAGLSVTRGNLPLFTECINRYARENLKAEDMVPTLEGDFEIRLSDLTLPLADSLRMLEPYGVGNPMPTFAVRGVTVNAISAVSDGKHTRLLLGDGHTELVAMYFSMSPTALGLSVGDTADVMFNPDVNEWLGRRSVQLIVKDIHRSGTKKDAAADERAYFAYIWSGGAFRAEDGILPTREDFATVYRFLFSAVRGGCSTMTHRELLAKLPHTAEDDVIGYVKLKVIIKVLTELNIVGIEEPSEEVYTFRIRYQTGKTDLERSGLLRRLRAQQRG